MAQEKAELTIKATINADGTASIESHLFGKRIYLVQAIAAAMETDKDIISVLREATEYSICNDMSKRVNSVQNLDIKNKDING